MTRIKTLRRRSALVAGFSVLLGTTAHAQSTNTTVELPDINVTATRLDVKPSPKPAPPSRIEGAPSGRAGPAAARRAGPPSPSDAAGPPTGEGEGASTAAAAGPVTLGITGASTSVITAAEIARSPEQTLPGILSREPGVQVSNLFGGVNAARSTVDVRGFGATGANNTLILINGRRMDQPDLQAFDWGSIPLNSVERVEITRGSSGGVLYGDGAVGGVINIVTKTGVNAPPSARVEAAYGSFNQVEGRASVTASSGPHTIGLFGNAIRSDGYRDNNQYAGLGRFLSQCDRERPGLGLPCGPVRQPVAQREPVSHGSSRYRYALRFRQSATGHGDRRRDVQSSARRRTDRRRWGTGEEPASRILPIVLRFLQLRLHSKLPARRFRSSTSSPRCSPRR